MLLSCAGGAELLLLGAGRWAVSRSLENWEGVGWVRRPFDRSYSDFCGEGCGDSVWVVFISGFVGERTPLKELGAHL